MSRLVNDIWSWLWKMSNPFVCCGFNNRTVVTLCFAFTLKLLQIQVNLLHSNLSNKVYTFYLHPYLFCLTSIFIPYICDCEEFVFIFQPFISSNTTYNLQYLFLNFTSIIHNLTSIYFYQLFYGIEQMITYSTEKH